MISRILHFTLLLGLLTQNALAEVADKCPLFVNSWVESEGSWNFLPPQEALNNLIYFALTYTLKAVGFYLVATFFKKRWLRFIPPVFTILIALFLILDFIPQSEPCSHYFWMREIPENLLWIQIGHDVVLLLVPLLLSIILLRKKAKKSPQNEISSP